MTLPAVTCPHCGRHFSRKSNCDQHIRDAHKKTKRIRPKVESDDESFASRAIQAELDFAMGEDNPDYDWLVELYK